MEKYQLPQQEKAALERLRQPFAVYQFVDKRVTTLALSDGFCRLFGFEDRAEAVYVMDHDMYRDTHPDDVARAAEAAIRFATEGGIFDVIYRTRIPGSTDYRILHAVGEHVFTDTGVRLAQVWYTDEGVYREGENGGDSALNASLTNALHESSILQATRYDYLTGLPSMTYFFELAESAKEEIWALGDRPVLLYMDFSGMKFFNTKHGFAAGDALLRAFSKVLSETFGSERSCRIGADHFAVLTEERGLDEKLNRLFRSCREMNGGLSLPVHVGVYVGQGEKVHISLACDRARLACDALNGRYDSAVKLYSKALSEAAENRRYVVENLDRALAEGWIQMYVQPIIRAVNGRVCEAEALARWVDPEKGVLSPASFIPALEDAGLLYKLDLYMLDEILRTMNRRSAEGFRVVPHSLNLSRSDFEGRDMVEEIRKRVDAAGVPRNKITIEITESVIGKNFDYMKEQVERFRALGFPVWMDDFGSGYSSLDVLQSIRFDLLKFDMSFMRKLNEGEAGKTILAELMRMATSLGVDTVCEGVETEEQVRFLQEIGCSKLQGFYFSKPIPAETLKEFWANKTLIERENPDESEYYESIGRVNLFDLGVIASEEKDALQHTFNTVPIGILEIRDGQSRYVRSNRSYQEFIGRFFHMDILTDQEAFSDPDAGAAKALIAAVKQSLRTGKNVFFDQPLPDGSLAHCFVRRVSQNAVTGSVAVAVAILSLTLADTESRRLEREKQLQQEKVSLGRIAALSPDYIVLYTVDPVTDHYTQYSPSREYASFGLAKQGEDFFADVRLDAPKAIAPEDMERHLRVMTKENMLREIREKGAFTHNYRLIVEGKPVAVSLRAAMVEEDGEEKIILGVTNDETEDFRTKLAETQKIRELNETISSLLNNMPALTFTKDAKTGVYLACNQAFAVYAHKNSPSEVAGFTDAEIFDEETAAHFVQDDRIALSMERPYVFFEDVPDARGDQRQFQTTKLRYTDAAGRECLLGMCQDVTDVFRMQRENAATKMAYRKARTTSILYTHLAHALAQGFAELYYVNTETGEYIEFHTDDKNGVLNEVRHGTDFFMQCRKEAAQVVHEEDREMFLRTLEADSPEKEREMTYRRIKAGVPRYMNMRISRMEDDPRYIVIAVSDVDELMRRRRVEERIREERIVYARLHALSGNSLCIYVVDPQTGSYREFNSALGYEESFAQAKEGEDFFRAAREAAILFNDPEDLDRFLSAFTKENVLSEVERSGIFSLRYRLLIDGRSVHVHMRAAMVEEKEGVRLIVGLDDIDAQVRQEEEYDRRLAQAQTQANLDGLTGVKNKFAYLEAEKRINARLADGIQKPFAVVVFDVNDLKKVNDSAGHQAGDRLLREASRTISAIFRHSSVYRVGGDEFVVITQGEDHARLDELLETVREHNRAAEQSGAVVIACGAAICEQDERVADTFARADRRMYENKAALKAEQKK